MCAVTFMEGFAQNQPVFVNVCSYFYGRFCSESTSLCECVPLLVLKVLFRINQSSWMCAVTFMEGFAQNQPVFVNVCCYLYWRFCSESTSLCECVPLLVRKVLFRINQSFAPLLDFSLWENHGSHSVGFSCRTVTFSWAELHAWLTAQYPLRIFGLGD